ncbi:MAG TPA: acetate--CoA ligase family protein, partial [Isosphaeraceae bacterium]
MSNGNLAHDLLRAERGRLDALFKPRNMAVIGATDRPGSVGRTVLRNLIGYPFGGAVFPVHPRRSRVLGIKAYPSIASVPDRVDLAILATPAATVPELIEQCAAAGVRGAIILASGFTETGPAGVALGHGVLASARRGRMRLLGPNCLGLMNPRTGLNATFANGMARPGSIGFLSQSGALCSAVLDWSFRSNIGFSAFVSVGSMLDVGWGDLIDHLGDDPHTKSIILYMETVGDARMFLSAAREVALTKPIIVLKAGRSAPAAQAVVSHTGALTGSDAVLDAAFRRCGVLRVDRISELFSMAEVLGLQPRPAGPRLTIVTNAGGPGVLATDALIDGGGQLSDLADQTLAALDRILQPHWGRNNPIDLRGDADPERYARVMEVVARDPNTDGVLVILTPQTMADPTQTAERLRADARVPGRPILASWMGGAEVAAGEAILQRAGISTFPFPDTAARAFNNMGRYSRNLRALYETPTLPADPVGGGTDRPGADALIASVRAEGRAALTEAEAKQLLALYGIPTVTTLVATTEEEAVSIAESLAYPVVLKLHSETITHKTDVGGVQLDLPDAAAVRRAYRSIATAVQQRAGTRHFRGVTVQPMIRRDGYELILGCHLDPRFGPVLLFGAGGQLVEVIADRALGLPPLNSTLARRLMERTRILAALKGIRGHRAVDLAALEGILVRFSQLVVEQRGIKEIEINPLLAGPEQILALDARVVVFGPELGEDHLPKLAIRPYPTRYVSPWTLADGRAVTIRPIRPEDEPLMVAFHQTLSDQSVYFRYFQALKLSQRVAHERLTRI